jgi:hypothetical protein
VRRFICIVLGTTVFLFFPLALLFLKPLKEQVEYTLLFYGAVKTTSTPHRLVLIFASQEHAI